MIKIIDNDGIEAEIEIKTEIVINPWKLNELKERLLELLLEYKL